MDEIACNVRMEMVRLKHDKDGCLLSVERGK